MPITESVLVGMRDFLCRKWQVWHFIEIKSQLSNFLFEPLLEYLRMNFSWWLIVGFSAHLSVNRWPTVAVMPFDDSFLTPSSTHILLVFAIVPLLFACLSQARLVLVGVGTFEWFGMQPQRHSVSLQEPSPYLLNGLWAREQKQREAEWEWLDSLQRASLEWTAAR